MMKKRLFILALLAAALPSHAMDFTRADVVGDWICQAKDLGYRQTGIIRYHADGTATEFAEHITKSASDASLIIASMYYHWQLKGDELHMSQMEMGVYEYYDFTPNGLVKADDAQTEQLKTIAFEGFQENNWHYLEFDGKDKHRYRFTDGFTGHCRRLS